jgi:phosphoglycolate phosphatase-like HAD superfamily hydrolase
MKWYEYFEWLIPGLPHDESVRLQEICFAISEADVEMQLKWLRPAEHALDVLAAIAGRHRQILVSNTRPATLAVFVDALRLSSFFPDQARFAINKHDRGVTPTKLALLSDYLDEHGPYDEVVVVGDSRSDMGMAGVGATTYLYAHPYLDFPDCAADHRIRDLRAVLQSL